MKGSSHLGIGLAVGAIAGYVAEPSITTIAICAGIGGVSGLAPDLDTNGLASNQITLSKKVVKSLMQFVGIAILLAIIYQVFSHGFTRSTLLYSGIGFVLLIVSRIITQRRILTLTGVMILLLGFVMHQSIGILLAGSYIITASFLPHRSYTHSLLGVAFYAWILHYLQQDWPITGMISAGIAGYISHLVADMKLLPMNRRGVKWFAPLWKKEF